MPESQSITLICDPLLSEYGPLRPAILIADRFRKVGKKITIVSTTISPKLQNKLDSMGIQTVNLQKEPFLKKNESIAWLEEWMREAAFCLNSNSIRKVDGTILNFSNTLCFPSHAWYALGPPTVTLNNMKKQLPLHYKITYLVISPILKILDKTLTRKIGNCSKYVVAGSVYLSSIYKEFGVHVNSIIYPPLDCNQFKPKTSNPSEDFVLTYFGKEAIFSLLKLVLDRGIKVKAFGGKLSLAPKKIREHHNLDFLGKIDDAKLIDLYSHALFTLYPFTDEPVGYIPIESMACGTPVLTFNKHGPKETIKNGETGWLANNDSELLELALRIWNDGYPKVLRKNCTASAQKYDVDVIADQWSKLVNDAHVGT